MRKELSSKYEGSIDVRSDDDVGDREQRNSDRTRVRRCGGIASVKGAQWQLKLASSAMRQFEA